MSPTNHGSAAHGSRSTEIRAVKASWYGVHAYTRAPATAASPSTPSSRKSQRAPSAATNERVPHQSRWATQSGAPSCSKSQNQGPVGHEVPELLVRHRAGADRRDPTGRGPAPSRPPGSR